MFFNVFYSHIDVFLQLWCKRHTYKQTNGRTNRIVLAYTGHATASRGKVVLISLFFYYL